VAEAVDGATADDPDLAAAATGPMLVGAAAHQPRRGGGVLSRGLFRRGGDTDEIEPVPAPVAEPVDPEELRYAPREPRRFLAFRRLLLVLVPVLLLVGAAVFGYVWSQNQYYVAPDGDQVAIYQGVQMDLPLIELSSLHQTTDVTVAELPCFDQEQVEAGIVASDLAAAERTVANLEERAEQQRRQLEAQQRREERQAEAERRDQQDGNQNQDGGSGADGGGGGSAGSSPSPAELDTTVDCDDTETS
jgi:PPM family protein phosphatase